MDLKWQEQKKQKMKDISGPGYSISDYNAKVYSDFYTCNINEM